ncbi:hypothetical protein I204_04745 [Kwoniella mangroviensis CBS 8886]|uniref:mitochondrial 54S ribosomal protein mL40 n=1 Tax=Kwoniella mangroviensis CBS 8507 TaxID=1296122 RepID=UPI00080D7D99|nr:uncharacterized protein I203_04054 [Kwoniella mangroviensis CBS 8507]OCF66478.1 hypothetical protein I203_04054 [Kwoniella mangroviensis CBS 8507]OCF74374.1 hypothetical protein I204_04745 [Kwoniella mangroviensis CBS 8886]
MSFRSVSVLRPTLPLPLITPTLTRTYAVKSSSSSSGNPALHVPTDSRSNLLRQVLYPLDSYSPTSSSPTGTYHPDHLNRLQAVIPSEEVHETIERAWQLHQRNLRQTRQKVLDAKFKAMVEACNELEAITDPSNGGVESTEGKGGQYHRRIYEIATSTTHQAERTAEERSQKGKKSVEQRWKETRIPGLFPRESWVPVESKGKGWEYDWVRPGY